MGYLSCYYDDVDRSIWVNVTTLGRQTRGREATLIKEQCRLDIITFSSSQMTQLVLVCGVNMFKSNIGTHLRGVRSTQVKRAGLLTSQFYGILSHLPYKVNSPNSTLVNYAALLVEFFLIALL